MAALVACTMELGTIEGWLDRGAELDAVDGDQWTAAHHFAAHNNVALLELLEEHGAALDKRNKLGQTPLHLAILNEAVEATVLLAATTPNTAVDVHGREALSYAVAARDPAFCRAVLPALLAADPLRQLVTACPDAAPPADSRCDIDVFEAAGLEAFPDAVIKDYAALGKPLLLRDWEGMRGLQAKWGKKKFLAKYGQVSTRAQWVPYASLYAALDDRVVNHTTFAEFAETLDDGETYVFQSFRSPGNKRLPESSPHRLDADFEWPDFMDAPWGQSSVGLKQFYLGPATSGSNHHYHAGSALNLLVHGEKVWRFRPRKDAFWTKAHPRDLGTGAASEEGYLMCTQSAGDVVLVPSGWSHSIVNSEPSIGYAAEFTFAFGPV